MPNQDGQRIGLAMSKLVPREIKAGNPPGLGWISRPIVSALPLTFWLYLIQLVLKLLSLMPGQTQEEWGAAQVLLRKYGVPDSFKSTTSSNILQSLEEAEYEG